MNNDRTGNSSHASSLPSLEGKRLLISEAGNASLPLAFGGISALLELEPVREPQEIEDRNAEIRRIVKRLLAIIEEHRIAAQRIDVTLNAAALGIVLSALEAETRGEDPSSLLATGGEIGSYVFTALYEELLAEPSNILHTTQVSPDVVRYEAMEAAFWKECLATLRQQLFRQ